MSAAAPAMLPVTESAELTLMSKKFVPSTRLMVPLKALAVPFSTKNFAVLLMTMTLFKGTELAQRRKMALDQTVMVLVGSPSKVNDSVVNVPACTSMSPRAGSTTVSTKPTMFAPTLVILKDCPPLLRAPLPLLARTSQRPTPPSVVSPARVRNLMAFNCCAPLLTMAPAPPTPTPETTTGSWPRFWPFTSSVAPPEIVVVPTALPSAAPLPVLSVPPLTSVAPG